MEKSRLQPEKVSEKDFHLLEETREKEKVKIMTVIEVGTNIVCIVGWADLPKNTLIWPWQCSIDEKMF